MYVDFNSGISCRKYVLYAEKISPNALNVRVPIFFQPFVRTCQNFIFILPEFTDFQFKKMIVSILYDFLTYTTGEQTH